MLLGIVLRRKIASALMGTQLMIKRDPRLGRLQKLPKGVIRSSIRYREFKEADKARGLAIIGRGSCPTHGLRPARRTSKIAEKMTSGTSASFLSRMGQFHFLLLARDCPRVRGMFLAVRFARSNLRSTA